jgi:hypothetical protein
MIRQIPSINALNATDFNRTHSDLMADFMPEFNRLRPQNKAQLAGDARSDGPFHEFGRSQAERDPHHLSLEALPESSQPDGGPSA